MWKKMFAKEIIFWPYLSIFALDEVKWHQADRSIYISLLYLYLLLLRMQVWEEDSFEEIF